ncbi:restriction endonuclease subunit S [Tanticharoenia sakaeratensis]|uniref:Type I restriction-modification system n=1 Tax=Tanticharoenia sakaeratensis NBRC 103193 TaxID=1231623 RepID=A0A0D6MN65_9PROT|nr:restriction endonuclease subunit S [Tanticharoenia sakaeratensis]GAN54835.1 type I restriction-modification system [Tanticharoenia sakaeratensis NBRC 103193]
MSLPQYPEYRASGVEWLGDVPAHWPCISGRRLFQESRISALEDDEQLSATQKYGVIPQYLFMKLEDQKVMLAIAGTGNFKRVFRGDFVISLRSFQGGIEYSSYDGCVSPAYTVLRNTQNIFHGFYIYYMKSKVFIDEINSSSEGVRDGRTIRYAQFGNTVFAVPPLSEQRAIAAFLDRECGKIDALIAEQERLIALLEEKRHAVISHAVTKGLDSKAPMKDSGIPWIGMVPEGWSVRRLSFIFDMIGSGTTPASDCEYYYGGDVYWVTTSELRERGICETTKTITNRALKEISSLFVYEPGTILFAMYGATIGRFGWLETYAAVNQACCAFSRPMGADRDFVCYALAAAKSFIILQASGGGQPNINQEKLRSFRIPLPSLNDQREIVIEIKKQLTEFDRIICSTTNSLEILRERRAALISAAVTGKIDVRGLVALEEAA